MIRLLSRSSLPPSRARAYRLVLAGTAGCFVSAGFFACGDSKTADPGPDASLVPVVITRRAECPAVAPSDGDGCIAPELTTCAYDACSGEFFVCRSHRWAKSGTVPGSGCPFERPEQGDPCPACWDAAGVCDYGALACSDGAPPPIRATCTNSLWNIASVACLAPSDAGSSDAGTGPDAAADADAGDGSLAEKARD